MKNLKKPLQKFFKEILLYEKFEKTIINIFQKNFAI